MLSSLEFHTSRPGVTTAVSDRNLSDTDKDWARGHLHELIEHLSQGGNLPFETKMKGGATATLISRQGHLLTNQHLVSGIQEFHRFPEKELVPEGLPMPHHRVETSKSRKLGPVRLCYVDSSVDLAVLKLQDLPGIDPIRTRQEGVRRLGRKACATKAAPRTATPASLIARVRETNRKGYRSVA